MKQFIGAFLFTTLVASLGYSQQKWISKDLAALKTTSPYKVFCQKKRGQFLKEVCAQSEKKGLQNFRLKSIEVMDASQVRLSDGIRSVQVGRGNNLSQYTINGRTVDLTAISAQDLIKSVETLLPRRAQWSFIQFAHAAEDLSAEGSDLASVVAMMISSVSEEGACQAAQRGVDICAQGDKTLADQAGGPFSQFMAQQLRYQQAKTYAEKMNSLSSLTTQANLLLAHLNQHSELIFQAFDAAPEACQVTYSNQGQLSAKEAFLACERELAKVQTNFEKGFKEMGVLTQDQNKKLQDKARAVPFRELNRLFDNTVPSKGQPAGEKTPDKGLGIQ